MSVFVYNPESVKTWARNVVSYLNGGDESVYTCSKKFGEQIEILVQPNVWTGAAAAQNYQNFMETHKALISFTNAFGSAFEEAMNVINTKVNDLEISNLGIDTNISATFGQLTYDRISQLSEENINKDVTTYDYMTIIEIGTTLNKIQSDLEKVTTSLKTKLEELNSGVGTWDGDAASSAKENLLNIVNKNMSVISEGLQICIKNISAAAQAAQQADQA